ncbi:hypothetical protein LshimejAT787_1002620 [Lyophyllum shimeji]|uniref:Methyltransferase ausD n=1 Tax=Lyophyllum shimeji TaxID=47721 RepID=A0A9P3PRY9_LYOSH|nr:hypothetical protein LshimejAT787_1002620 [Lyophyllum shimeji]
MSRLSKYADPLTKPPLDESLYGLSPEEFDFFKAQTGIEDEDVMKRHIIAIQKKAYEIYGYPCIRTFSFTKLKIYRLPAYQSALKLLSEHPDAILLDIGCCFGNDVRKAVADGWPVRNVIASDLVQGFWDLGHELFKSTPETVPAAFIAGDAFDPNILAPGPPVDSVPQTPRPDLRSLTSLNPLQGRISVIHASSFFHLFGKERQEDLARRLATLLSPLPGSVIFGSHGGSTKPEYAEDGLAEHRLFRHSPESWTELWDGNVFEKGKVKVETRLKQVERPDSSLATLLVWSVTRQ